jgi:Tfp pilus assembly pilus retraction ATPase PilT
MRLPESVDRLLGEARARGVSTLHLLSGSAPRIRIGGELRPLEVPAADPAAPPVLVAGPPPAELEALVASIVAPDDVETIRRRGQGEFFVRTDSGQSFVATVYRSMEQWRVVFHLAAEVQDSPPAKRSIPV